MERKVYSKEFKLQAVKRMLDNKLPATQVAAELGISPNTLRDWAHTYSEKPQEPFVGRGNLRSEDKSRKELEKKIRDLEEENAILKKAAAVFAKNQKF